ncbi:hypothetical protein CCACVL1_17631 [Corchorus capsularis]|uniref:Uncharacterized protein n=1 Tax=Corchorus capsularis TaxID=210143 RepID=A0A1R3HR22_COCAP|nr:hypothetical protein CCACVL1_17631 [Corchorus capsularis]
MRQELLGEIGTTNVLYQLLSDACQERDEAREQLKRSVSEIIELKKLLNKLSNNSAETSSAVSHFQPNGTQKQEILKGIGSDSMSEPYNNCSDDSSATNSMSRTMFNPNLSDSSGKMLKKSLVQDSGGRFMRMGKFPSKELEVDRASKVIEKLVKGKSLPEKGRLLEAVLDTQPLLETLMITGQLPKWRNPPPLPPSFIANESLVNSKSATSSSFKKRSIGVNIESMEAAGIKKRFH